VTAQEHASATGKFSVEGLGAQVFESFESDGIIGPIRYGSGCGAVMTFATAAIGTESKRIKSEGARGKSATAPEADVSSGGSWQSASLARDCKASVLCVVDLASRKEPESKFLTHIPAALVQERRPRLGGRCSNVIH
jgi:hypothetical protein